MTVVTRRSAIVGFAAAAIVSASAPGFAAGRPGITVWKDPNCGCCGAWVKHLEQNGFVASVIATSGMSAIKAERSIPSNLASCHTGELDGYLIEGHVPAHAILRLLAERPAIRGLAVPGMPIGSPGMEGGTPETFDVIAFAAKGQSSFGRYRGAAPA